MIGKIVSALIGKKIASRTPGVDAGTGAVIGLVAETALRRMGPLGFAAAAAGGWAVSRHLKKKQAARTGQPA